MFTEYTIKEGKHSSGLYFRPTFSTSIEFEAYFTESCLYKLNNIDDYDINKLAGISTSYKHHYQSARVGWRCFNSRSIELLTYSYSDGVRDTSDTRLGLVKPYQVFRCKVEDLESRYVFTYNGTKQIVKEKKADYPLFQYYLFPFFGGSSPAPHTMSLFVKWVK